MTKIDQLKSPVLEDSRFQASGLWSEQMLVVCENHRISIVKTNLFLFYFIGDGMVETVRGQLFTVGPRYTNLQYIGEGAYGMVA